MKLQPDTRVSRTPDTVWREIDGRTVIISLDDGRIRTLNPTGAAVWAELDGRSVSELVATLQRRFPGRSEAELEADVGAFLEDLLTRGMAKVDG